MFAPGQTDATQEKGIMPEDDKLIQCIPNKNAVHPEIDRTTPEDFRVSLE
jgi:hypothetical protein